MSNETKGDKKYNKTLSGLWNTKGGNFRSMKIDARTYDALVEAGIGGMLLVKVNKYKKGETHPDAYLEYISPEDVAAFKTQNNQTSSDEI